MALASKILIILHQHAFDSPSQARVKKWARSFGTSQKAHKSQEMPLARAQESAKQGTRAYCDQL